LFGWESYGAEKLRARGFLRSLLKLDFWIKPLIRGGNRALNATTTVSSESLCPSTSYSCEQPPILILNPVIFNNFIKGKQLVLLLILNEVKTYI